MYYAPIDSFWDSLFLKMANFKIKFMIFPFYWFFILFPRFCRLNNYGVGAPLRHGFKELHLLNIVFRVLISTLSLVRKQTALHFWICDLIFKFTNLHSKTLNAFSRIRSFTYLYKWPVISLRTITQSTNHFKLKFLFSCPILSKVNRPKFLYWN